MDRLKCFAVFSAAIILILALFPYRVKYSDSNIVYVETNMSPYALAEHLEEKGAIKSALVFKALAKFTNLQNKMHSGEYQLPKRGSILEVMNYFADRKNIYLRKITIPEGLRSSEILKLLSENPYLVADVSGKLPEGIYLPETYNVSRGTKVSYVLQLMEKAQQDLLNKLMPDLQKGLPYKSRKDIIILASMVEQEAGFNDERGLIASVFVNRLRKGMRLQSDPTAAYGVGRPNGAGLTVADLKHKNPYNTYQVSGLPSGPISNPGAEAIKAVINPPSNKYLYFVANGEGGHHFNTNLSDHNRDVKKWRAIEKSLLSQEN